MAIGEARLYVRLDAVSRVAIDRDDGSLGFFKVFFFVEVTD